MNRPGTIDLTDAQAAGLIIELFREGFTRMLPVHREMGVVTRAFNGDLGIPLPEMQAHEMAAVPNLIFSGINQYGQRVASVRPQVTFPSMRSRPNGTEYLVHARTAEDQRAAVMGWWEMNELDVMAALSARHLAAYGAMGRQISHNAFNTVDKRRIPHWKVMDPLLTLPGHQSPDSVRMSHVIYIEHHTSEYCKMTWPEKWNRLYKGAPSDDSTYRVLEYVDEHEYVFLMMGRDETPGERRDADSGYSPGEILGRVQHNLGVCPSSFAGRLGLDRIQGQFSQTVGMYVTQSMLMSLATIAVKKSVYPEKWAQSPANAPTLPTIEAVANSMTGEIGIVQNGQLQVVHTQLSGDLLQLMDRLERSARITGGTPSDVTGESATNVRTGRRGSDIMSATMDPQIAEDQARLRQCYEWEIEIGIRVMRTFFGDAPSQFFIPVTGEIHEDGEYIPNQLFKSNLSPRVTYPIPGTDVSGLIVELGQMQGMKSIDPDTAREMNPLIQNPAEVKRRIMVNDIDTAVMATVTSLAGSGNMDPRVLTMMRNSVLAGDDPGTAYEKAHAAMQKEQADQANAMAQQTQGAQPELQPGATQGPQNPIVPGAQPQGGAPGIQSLLARLGGSGGAPKGPMPPLANALEGPQGASATLASSVPAVAS